MLQWVYTVALPKAASNVLTVTVKFLVHIADFCLSSSYFFHRGNLTFVGRRSRGGVKVGSELLHVSKPLHF